MRHWVMNIRRKTSSWRRARLLRISCRVVAILALGSPWMSVSNDRARAVEPENLPLPSASPVGSDSFLDPQRVEGPDKCIDCHRSESIATATSHHATKTFNMLRSGALGKDSREIAEKLNISPSTLASKSICIECHATPQVDQQGRHSVLPGVSCESCHGTAGGDDGWLNMHAVYGPEGTRRETESKEHYLSRTERCLEAGQLRSANSFQLARACYHCHLVGHESLVNTGDHPSGSEVFEFVAWTMGEVRHNFHVNQYNNAIVSTLWADPLWRPEQRRGKPEEHVRVMYVSGQLAKLYVSLRNRALALEDGDYASAMEVFIEEAQGELEAIVEEYNDQESETEAGEENGSGNLDSLQQAVDTAIEALETVGDMDDPWSDSSLEASVQIFEEAALVVEAAAVDFLRSHDGSDLQIVDDFAPEMETLETQEEGVVIGKAWEP